MAVAMMVDDPEGSQEIHERVRDLLAVAGPCGRNPPPRRTEPERRLAA
jgi:hypothetical protein